MVKQIDETLAFSFGSGGGSGPTRSAGEQIVWRALSAGHQATALARRPDAVGFADPWPRVLAGDVPDPASLGVGVAGYDIEPGLNKQEPYVV